MRRPANGFTLVELLIVIVVIAILASISIVAYNGIQSRAHDAAIRSDLRNIRTKLEIYKIDNDTYPFDPVSDPINPSGTAIKVALQTIDMKLSTGSYNTSTANTNLLYIASNDGQHYAILGYAKGNPTYYITDSNQSPAVYTGNGTSQSEYPGGSPGGISSNLGISNPAFYYIYTKSSGGFRVWS